MEDNKQQQFQRLTPDEALKLLSDATGTITTDRKTHVAMVHALEVLQGVIDENKTLKDGQDTQ